MKKLILLMLSSCLAFVLTNVSAKTADDESHAAEVADTSTPSITERVANGGKIYSTNCAACHQTNGKGLTGAFPPLAESDYIADDPMKIVSAVINGLSGPMIVNDADYNSVMPNLAYMSDSDVADVVTFVLNSFGNKGGSVGAAQVAAARDGEKGIRHIMSAAESDIYNTAEDID